MWQILVGIGLVEICACFCLMAAGVPHLQGFSCSTFCSFVCVLAEVPILAIIGIFVLKLMMVSDLQITIC